MLNLIIVILCAGVLLAGVLMAAMGASSTVFMGLGGVVFGGICAFLAYKSVTDPQSLSPTEPIGIGSTILFGAIAAVLFFGGLWVLIARPF